MSTIPSYIDELDFDKHPTRTIPDETRSESRSSTRGSVTRDYLDQKSRLFDPAPPQILAEGLAKDRFFTANIDSIRKIIQAVNTKYALADGIKLSPQEVFGVCYAEIGLKSNGDVDPKYDHQAGEYGLLPLSDQHKYFTGSDAPDPHGLYEPAINVEEFVRYLGSFRTETFYSKLYTVAGISGNTHRLTQVTAASVHGYFYSGNYTPKTSRPKVSDILQVIIDDGDLADFLENTTYKAMARRAVRGRIKNINAGIALADGLPASGLA